MNFDWFTFFTLITLFGGYTALALLIDRKNNKSRKP